MSKHRNQPVTEPETQPVVESDAQQEPEVTPPPVVEQAAEVAPALRWYRVVRPYTVCQPAAVQATSVEEALKLYDEKNGIISTPHEPEVTLIDGPEGEPDGVS